MNTSCETKELSVSDILKDIKKKRNNFNRLHPLKGRQWYIATGTSVSEFYDQYPDNTFYEDHYFIESKAILDEVFIKLIKGAREAEIESFLKSTSAPAYLFNYCFYFK